MSARARWCGTWPCRWLGIWLLSRIAIWAIVVTAAYVKDIDRDMRLASPTEWFLYRFAHWDSHLYGALAVRGYVAEGPGSHYNAFFPGLPGVMKSWSALTGTDGRWGGLLVVTLAGAVGATLLGTLAANISGDPRIGTYAVLLVSCTPLTVYFSVVYTEAVFMCLSLGAWILACRDRWAWAGVLSGLACTFRLNGLFLVASLAAFYIISKGVGARAWRIKPGALTLLLGPFFIICWAVWLHRLTGQWNAWTSAQEQGWGRTLAWPWVGVNDALVNLRAADSWHLALSRILDLAAVGIALIAPIYCVVRRNWPFAILLGLNAATLIFSSIFVSGARYILVWFPLYIFAARFLAERRILLWAILIASSTLALILSYAWSQQYWIA